MKAMIFAAGLGTRLKPITDTLPKALVPVCGRPLIEHVCRKLMASGINEAVVNIHHFADKIEAWAEVQDWVVTSEEDWEGMDDKEGKIFIEFSDERDMLLETGGAVLHARKYLEGCGHFLIHNVDIFSNADIKWLESQVRQDALATLLVSRRQTKRYLLFHPETMKLVGWLNTDQNDHHLADQSLRVEDCRALGFSGIHILSDEVLELMDEYVKEKNLPVDKVKGTKFPIMNFYMWAAARRPIYGAVAENLDFLDVGKLDTIELAEAYAKKAVFANGSRKNGNRYAKRGVFANGSSKNADWYAKQGVFANGSLKSCKFNEYEIFRKHYLAALWRNSGQPLLLRGRSTLLHHYHRNPIRTPAHQAGGLCALAVRT